MAVVSRVGELFAPESGESCCGRGSGEGFCKGEPGDYRGHPALPTAAKEIGLALAPLYAEPS